MVDCQPSALSRDTSSSLRGVPSGLLASKPSRPWKPVTRAMVSASSRMVQSTPVPTLMCDSIGCVWARYCSTGSCSTCTLAAAMSSTCRNSRIGVPLPQITTSAALDCTAS